ncbi:hypothetical protein GOODEAATRI_019473 [Goodea atripinnis]|uniref:[F-actin]-monooxygenase MICAL1-3-like Rossman domain-containing protein n=1 Tax=Goodea atripinnis TaxID=208336 RepID=A0ABV0NLK3_9TELE
MASKDHANSSHATFDLFVQAKTCQEVKQHFSELCRQLQLDSKDFRGFYTKLKERLNYWKAKALWTKLDKRASQEVYQQGTASAQNKVVLLEKREEFTRNNVLHLWPFTIYDLRELGAKKFYGKFCCGSLDHISIRQLQLILLKVSLLLGVEHKELRGKLAIGITANFINRKTAAEVQVPEISGVARIYNQKFFQDLLNETEQLLAPGNVDHVALCLYAHDAAYFSTGGKLPELQFAQNQAGQQDVAMFDFTCMQRAENASLVRERRGKKLLIALVGDCLVELLSQTTPDNTSKKYSLYSIDPTTRYQSVNLSAIQAHQVSMLIFCLC